MRDVLVSSSSIILSLLLLTAAAPAQEPSVLGEPAGQPSAGESTNQHRDVRFLFGAAYSHRFDTNLDTGGEIGSDTFSAGLNVTTDLSRDVSLDFRLNYGLTSYDFAGDSGLGALDPWNDIHTLFFGAAISFDIDSSWTIFGGPIFQFARESGADWGESFTGGGIVGVTYQISPTLLLGGGAGIITQLENDVRVFPIIIIEWKIAEQWRLSSRGASAGRTSIEFTGIELIYSPSKPWEFALGGGSSFSRFRLDEGGLAPSAGGVGKDESMPIWLRATWHPTREISIDALGGVAVAGEMNLEDAGGDTLAASDYDPAAFLGIFGTIRF